MSFHEELEARTKQAEEILQKYLPAKEEAYQKTVMDAMHYSAMAGGKRLRPVLMKECFILFGGTGEIIEPWYMMIFRQWIMTNTGEESLPHGKYTANVWRFWQATDC